MPISRRPKLDVSPNGFHPVASPRSDGIRPFPPESLRPKPSGKHPLVLSEALFSHLLVRERKRSDRSNRPFILLALKTKNRLNLESSRIGKAIMEALSAATRETDVVGWVESPTVIGVIFSEIGAVEPARAVETVRARVYRDLRRVLDAGSVGDLSLHFHIYPETRAGDSTSDPGSVDPLLHPDLRRTDRRRRISDWIKRALDVVASVALLVALAPLLLVVGLLVRLTSPGPVLFRQLRIGRMGTPFRMLKFRTMYVNAGENPHHEFISRFIKESGRAQGAGKNELFKLTNDPRVTPVGRILRKTSIDELPQLWNVLIGEMSLVGPRPPLPYEIEQYASWHRRRVLEAKPGITGLWQVTGRSRTTFDDMVRLDLRYAKTQSLWTDIRILLRTPKAVVSGKGAC